MDFTRYNPRVYERVVGATLRSSRASVLLLGPRQTGKSTLLRALAPDLVLDLADPATFRDYVAYPEKLAAELRGASAGVRTVMLDEVQRVPALLDVVQVLVDERPRRFRFLLSGSSARKLRRGQANLLPGRVQVHQLHPLLLAELAGDADLERVMAHGSLPGIYAETDARERAAMLRAYAHTYLREEIQAEALVRDVGGYSRLLDLVAASSGRIVNLAALSRDVGIGHETARRYLDVMRDTLVAFDVPAFAGSDRASLVAHPKTFLFDCGVRNALLRRPLDRVLDDDRGLLLEHVVGYELHRRIGTHWPDGRLSHYRTKHGAEVDFVLEIGRERWGIEVKAGRHVHRADLSGLESLAARARLARRVVVFLGARAQSIDGVDVLPLDRFLGELN